MKTFTIIGILSAGVIFASAQTATNIYSVSPNAAIPIGNQVGLVSQTSVVGLVGDTISSITVTLNITGGYNGSLYAYLSGPNGGFDVLLNQSGSSGGSIGYLDNGFNITLDDNAANNVQTYQAITGVLPANTQLTGTWQSAGNAESSFVGNDPNGTWTLFVANLTGGSPQSTLANWGLTITTTPVPEPQIMPLLISGLLVFIGVGRRQFKRPVSAS